MKRMLTIAITAAAVLALPVSAHAARRELFLATAKGDLAAGAEMQLVSSNFTLSGGVAQCQTTDILGTLTNNGAAKDVGSLASGHFEGTEAEGACASASGPAKLEAAQLSWALELTAKNTAAIKAKKVTIVVAYPTATGAPTCTYQAGKLKSTPIYFNGPGEAATLTLTEQTLKRNKKVSSSQCAPSTNANGVFELKSNGESVVGTIEELEHGCEEVCE
jgi:hypothetical protein